MKVYQLYKRDIINNHAKTAFFPISLVIFSSFDSANEYMIEHYLKGNTSIGFMESFQTPDETWISELVYYPIADCYKVIEIELIDTIGEDHSLPF